MGLLTEGSPLSWQQTKVQADHVRQHGIQQFINLYHRLKDRSGDCLKWGDEVEYMLVQFDHDNKKVRLSLDAHELLVILQEMERTKPNDNPTSWKPEYASYMIEGTPGKPYGHRMAHFNMVEANMRLRREEVLKQLLEPGATALSLTAFPSLGCPDFTVPRSVPTPTSGASRSLFFPEEAIYQNHPRFSTITRNIRQRRGEKVAINIPVYKDAKTADPFVEDFSKYGDDGEAQSAAKPDHIYMDCMGYGMGCSCLQMTFQAVNIQEARTLYDQLNPLCPIMLALSAACPIHRGFLADTDCRWDIISASVDCRTREERGQQPLKDNRYVIPKSRYASISSYLSPGGAKYNDVNLVMDQDIYNTLRQNDIDELLAQHIAHLFIRDPVSLFSEKIDQNDEEDTDHFENIQSTNWQTMRFKPPPPNSPIGWRVEFRPTEVQLTDFENAAYVVFIALLTRVILSYRLNMIIPISKVDENMKNAHKRDAVLNQKFYFRKEILTCNSPKEAEEMCCSAKDDDCCNDEYTLMTVNEIINGKAGEFPGLVPLIYQYLGSVDDCDVDTSCTIKQYLSFLQNRASGKLMTIAHWMREFVTKHPLYKQDSVVPDEISYDLVCASEKITSGELKCPELLPSYETKSSGTIPTAMAKEEMYHEKKRQTVNGDASSLSPGTNGCA